MRRLNQRGFAFSFGWIFAIIVGAAIIALAIYAATKFVGTEKLAQNTEAGKELGVILTPAGTGIESGKVTHISNPQEIRIYNSCLTYGNFGSQGISTSIKSGIGKTWAAPGGVVSFHNKYMFSAQTIQGRDFIVFTKPFSMPFKIADLMFIWPSNESYCFVNPGNDVEKELETISGAGGIVNSTDDVNSCLPQSKKVCFNIEDPKCNVVVNTASQSVKKNGATMYYEGNLIYGAIFSDPGTYECQVQRLMKRTAQLSYLYATKSLFLAPEGCGSTMSSGLIAYANETSSLNDSFQLGSLQSASEELNQENKNLVCKIF